MRRILRKIAEDEYGNLGDTSTLADPAVVDDLVHNRQNKKGDGAPIKVATGGSASAKPAATMLPQHEKRGFFSRLFGG
jgi:hypothetical protein